MNRSEMERRTKQLGLRVMKLTRALPKSVEGRAIASQLVRSGTSVGANYRFSGRARSKAEFRAKLGIAEEECDETCYWLEVIIEDGMLPARRVQPLLTESREILAMIIASINTSRSQ